MQSGSLSSPDTNSLLRDHLGSDCDREYDDDDNDDDDEDVDKKGG